MSKRTPSPEPFDPTETKKQYTLKQVLGTAGTIFKVLDIPPPSIEPNIGWNPDTGPDDTRALSQLAPGERNALSLLPFYQLTEIYLDDLEGGEPVDLEALAGHGWTIMGVHNFDDRYECYRLMRDGWHLLLAVDGDQLVYWMVVNSDDG